MIMHLLAKIFGTKNDRTLKRLRQAVATINGLEEKFQQLKNEDFPVKTEEFKTRYHAGESLDALLPEAFALVREAGIRALGMRLFDVQLIGGMVLHQGKISEMRTGEGKTFVATLPLYLNSLTGKGAHLVTVNDYLAKRDAEWMQPLYNFLGASVGIIQHDMDDQARKDAYNSDITYGTNNEFGFDYLRDNMKFDLSDYAQRELNFVIVDEVDSILIDEARTPLIISGASEKGSDLYITANKAVKNLSKEEDYEVDEKARSVHLTESGTDKVEKYLSIENLYAPEYTLVLHHVTQALKAHSLFKRDVDYVVANDEVLIVDEFTGRILPGRRYSDGLHQALEAKEGVKIEKENQTLASITLQNFFRMYNKLSGMTGTAATDAEEFHKIYKLDVVAIPTNKPIARIDEPDVILLTKEDKYVAILEDIKESVQKGMPVLVGTISVEVSELIGALLRREGIPHNILNAKQHEREADIVAEAGQVGKITIATNMAGRGTDIKLSPEALANGGLRIIGTERHESRRIDNQLRGRAGRQGDPGSSKFYISLEDDLIRIFAGDRLKNMMERVGMERGEKIEHGMVNRSIEKSQEKVEKHHFESRKHLIEYDDVLNQQRKVVYAYRRQILEGAEQISEIITQLIHDVVTSLSSTYIGKRVPTEENITEFFESLEKLTGVSLTTWSEKVGTEGGNRVITDKIIETLESHYREFRSQADPELIEQAEKWILLELIDQHWKIHLHVLDSIKEGINLRGYGQKNPLLEYKKETFDAFSQMMHAVKWDSIERLCKIRPENFTRSHIEKIEHEREKEMDSIKETSSDNSEDQAQKTVKREAPKVGRNDKCPCGSGKKYKQCHGKNGTIEA